MNKEHQYRKFTFHIKVELNHTIENPPDGSIFGEVNKHKIIINDMGVTNYYKTAICETSNLIDTINLLMEDAEQWADERLDEYKPYEVKLLESMGFKK